MNVSMILDNRFPVDPRVENEALTLIEHGHQVSLFCFQDENQSLTSFEIYKGIHVHRFTIPRYFSKANALVYTIPLYRWVLSKKIKGFLMKTNPNVVHIHDLRLAKTVFNLVRKMKVKVVLDLHENAPEIIKSYGYVNTFIGKCLIYPKIWKRYENRFIKESTNTIVVTEEAKLYYESANSDIKDKIVVLPNSISPSFYVQPEIDNAITSKYQNDYCMIYIGDTSSRRGLKIVVDSLEKLSTIKQNIKLIILGTSSDLPELVIYAKEKGVSKYIDFVGWVSDDLFPSYLQASKIGLCPIERNIHHDTTYANKLFQYLAFGLPIIASNCTAQESLINKYRVGGVFHWDSSEDFTNKVMGLIVDENLYDNTSKNAVQAIVSSLNWDILSNELINLYDNYERN